MFRFFRRPKVRSRQTRPSRRPRRRQGTTRFLTELSPQRRRQIFFENLRESGRRKRRRIAPRPSIATDKPRQTPNRSVFTKDRAVEEKRIMEQRARDLANRQNLANQRLIQEQNKKFKAGDPRLSVLGQYGKTIAPKQRKDFDTSKVRFLTPKDLYGALMKERKKREGKDIVLKPRRIRQRPSIKVPGGGRSTGIKIPKRSTGYTSAKQVRSASPVTTTVKAPPKKRYTGLRVDPVRAKRRRR